MATLTSHTLSSVDGTHAGGIAVTVHRIAPDGCRQKILETMTDEGGRLRTEIHVCTETRGDCYEMVLATGVWFESLNLPRSGPQIVSNIVVRFAMPDPDGHYHVPLIIGPNGYSIWWSS